MSIHTGHENKQHEYVTPLDYDQQERLKLEEERVNRATSRQIPVVKKHVVVDRGIQILPRYHLRFFNFE